jgi:serine/threonine-protein kinase HipA
VHILALDDANNEPDLDTVLATAEFYRVTPRQAQDDWARLRTVLATWKNKAKQLGLSAEDRAEIEGCFQV